MRSEFAIKFEFWKDSVRRNWHFVAIGLFLVIFVLWLSYPSTQALREVNGEVVAQHSKNSGKGMTLYISVRLRNGDEVLVRAPDSSMKFMNGQSVNLLVLKNTLFSKITYKLVDHSNE